MHPAKHKIAADCWKKATEALARENWDYAVRMFAQAVELEPDNLAYRQHLRGAQKKMYGDNKSGARMAGVRLMTLRGRIKKAKMQKAWETLDKLAEEGLKLNPWDAQLNADVGEACKNLGYNQVAVFGYDCAVAADGENLAYLRELAQLQEDRGNYKEAMELWRRVQKLDPMDGQARSKATQLEASSAMVKGGYEQAKSTHEMKTAYDYDRRPTGTKPAGPPVAEGPGADPEADLERAIRKNPADKDSYLKLAELYKRRKRLDDAAELLKKALELSGGDVSVRELLEDVELEMLRQNLDLAKESLRASQDDETAKKNAAALARECLQREMEVLSSRVERYPKDSRLKFDLAKRYMRLRKWSEAIPLLQRASADSRIECEVLVSLGECFYNDGQKDIARRQFQKAVEKIDPHEQEDLFKRAHYALGVLCEETQKRDEAETHFSEVLGIDYDYRDTRQRLERLQAGETSTE